MFSRSVVPQQGSERCFSPFSTMSMETTVLPGPLREKDHGTWDGKHLSLLVETC